MDRRGFLKLAGSGLLVAAAPAVALAEPRRRFWQVSRDAPVPAYSRLLPPWSRPYGYVYQGSATNHFEIREYSDQEPFTGELFGIDASRYQQWNSPNFEERPLTWEEIEVAVDQLNRAYTGNV